MYTFIFLLVFAILIPTIYMYIATFKTYKDNQSNEVVVVLKFLVLLFCISCLLMATYIIIMITIILPFMELLK